MTTITSGMTPTQFINAMNSNFMGAGSTLTTSSTIITYNSNFDSLASLYDISLSHISYGMSGGNYLNTINTNFQNISDIIVGSSAFEFTINLTDNTTAGKRLTLPLISGAGERIALTPNYNFIVDWGDGTTNLITAYDSGDRIHNYSTTGTKIVKINGICEAWRVNNNAEDKLKYISLDNFTNIIGFKALDFYGCANMESISSTINRVSSIINLENGWRDCDKITLLPDGIFDGFSNLIILIGTFKNSGLSLLKNGMLDDCINVTNMDDFCMSCTSIKVLPDHFVDKLVNILSFCGTFQQCDIDTIPNGFFDYNIKLQNAPAFGSNARLTSVPAKLLDNCPLITSVQSFFIGTAIESIPSGFFSHQKLLTSIYSVFYGCTSLIDVEENIFDGLTAGYGSFISCFEGCSAYTGAVPELWSKYPGNYTHDNCFKGCINASNYESIPNDWKGV